MSRTEPDTAASSVLEHRFGAGEPFTLGVEEEFMLLDPESWDLVAHIEPLLNAAAGGEFAQHIHSELMQSVVEITTPVCAGPAEIALELRRLRRYVSETAAAGGCRLASAGTHPFSRFEGQKITRGERYDALVEEFRHAARQQLIFGLHLHVAVDDAEKAIAVADGLVTHLADFLALSANSPFWRGESTGLQSCRHMIYSALPRAGVPPRFSSYAEYADLLGTLERGGFIPDYTHVRWDVRLHPRLGTVELRVCDAVTRLEDAVALAAYVQALVKMLCDELEAGRPIASFHPTLTTENKWLAARDGLDAAVLDLAGGTGERTPVRALIRRTLRALEPHARELGSERELEGILEILGRGNGADAQLRSWNTSGSMIEVVRELARASEAPSTPGSETRIHEEAKY